VAAALAPPPDTLVQGLSTTAPLAETVAPAATPVADAVAPWTVSIAPLAPSPAAPGTAAGPTPASVTAATPPASVDLHGAGLHGLPVTAAAAPSHPAIQSVQTHSDFAALPIDNAFPFDPSIIAHGLATWESRFLIGAILGGLLTGRAAGIGMIDFTQPMLQACNLSVRAAFSQVRLVPCEQASRAVRSAVQRLHTGEGVRGGARRSQSHTSSSVTRREGDRPESPENPLHAVSGNEYVATRPFSALKPFFWSIPAAGGMLLRLFACMLAALSAMIAGRAGIKRHSRDRNELPYRRRLES
jgi:hypothetical protein